LSSVPFWLLVLFTTLMLLFTAFSFNSCVILNHSCVSLSLPLPFPFPHAEDKNRFYRGNMTMYTGKDDVNKVRPPSLSPSLSSFSL